MSDKSLEWQNELQAVVHNPNAPDVSTKVAHLRATLTARLRIMTPVDKDERLAIKRALSALRSARPKGRNRRELVLENQHDWRSLIINLARRGLSCSLTAVNFSANPRPGSTRFTIPSARICPSWTRNSSLTVEPKFFDARVSINKPPKLIFPTREMSSCPAQRQSTQTFASVWMREVNLLDGTEFLSMC